ncbi:MAG: lipoyl(octanoyl) transferase LipB [Leptospiraceae bacterium]|nr:lipoyl(octanoyl) transferase LipB [Leptospiraceae bacterium]MDW8306408.1 lipoyl(octanoyl) transferase LipB [Leptospiraceae bacterium]
MEWKIQYWGLVPYQEAMERMDEAVLRASQTKEAFVFGLEHPLVYTAGLKTIAEHILAEQLEVLPARRGGSVTLHNPGQLVVYFAIPLEKTPGLATFVRYLEGSIIETLWEYGVLAFQRKAMSGVFTREGKIAFVGLGLKKNVIYHGIAVNIANSLEDYQVIRSCGLSLPVNRLVDVCNEKVSLEEFFRRFVSHLRERFRPIRGAPLRDYLEGKIKQLTIPQGVFRLGQLYFNERRYHYAHEAWELAWHIYRRQGNNRDYLRFLHGLIQLAMAYDKLEGHNNPTGFHSLYKKAREKLNHNPYTSLYLCDSHELFWDSLSLTRDPSFRQKTIPFLSCRLDLT